MPLINQDDLFYYNQYTAIIYYMKVVRKIFSQMSAPHRLVDSEEHIFYNK